MPNADARRLVCATTGNALHLLRRLLRLLYAHLLLQLPDAAHAIPQKGTRVFHMCDVVCVTAAIYSKGQRQGGRGCAWRQAGMGKRAARRAWGAEQAGLRSQARPQACAACTAVNPRLQTAPKAAVGAVLLGWIGASRRDGPRLVPPVGGGEACRHSGRLRERRGGGMLAHPEHLAWPAGSTCNPSAPLTSLPWAQVMGAALRRPWRSGR